MHSVGMAGERVQYCPIVCIIVILDVRDAIRAPTIIGWVGALSVGTVRTQGCTSFVDIPLAVLSSALQQCVDRPNDDRPVCGCRCKHGAIGREADVPYLEEDDA